MGTQFWRNDRRRLPLLGECRHPYHDRPRAGNTVVYEQRCQFGRTRRVSLWHRPELGEVSRHAHHGTGIGGGVILSPDSVLGRAQGPLILLGGNKGGAELGHVVVQHKGLDCNAGTYGSIEAYAQRDGIIHRAQHRLMRKRESVLREMVKGDYSKITPLHLSQAASQGDELAIEVWAEVGEMLGVAIGSFINVFAPDIVAIGGQIAKAGDFLLRPARKTARNIAIPALFDDAKIVEAEQVEDAGLLGAAALALEALRWKTA